MLYTDDDKFALTDLQFSDFERVKAIVTKDKPEDRETEARDNARQNKTIGITFIVMSLFPLAVGVIVNLKQPASSQTFMFYLMSATIALIGFVIIGIATRKNS